MDGRVLRAVVRRAGQPLAGADRWWNFALKWSSFVIAGALWLTRQPLSAYED